MEAFKFQQLVLHSKTPFEIQNFERRRQWTSVQLAGWIRTNVVFRTKDPAVYLAQPIGLGFNWRQNAMGQRPSNMMFKRKALLACPDSKSVCRAVGSRKVIRMRYPPRWAELGKCPGRRP